MLIPKPSHLVERVAERLLRSGASGLEAMDDSAARLLRPGSDEAPSPDLATQGTVFAAPSAAPPVVPPVRRSSLFAPAPVLSRPAPPVANGIADQPSGTLGETPGFEALEPDPVSDAAPLASGAIHGQNRAPRQATTSLHRAADFGGSAPPSQRGAMPDPAAGMPRGPVSIDAVSLERAGMVDWSRTRTRISEEFRLVQRQVIRSAFGPGAEPGFSNLLMVTSAKPGEGKSFMATNLSGSIARQGDHHVLLVDADSKRDSICYSLGLAQSRGLLDLAADPKLDPGPLIVKTPIERLSILPVGRERERSAELFSTKEMTRLIQSLGRRYADRLLILDAPPCLSTSDPAVLAQVVGQILFVVEADRTQRDEIEASLDLIQACPTITMVLNKQRISSRYTFGAYSSYYSS